MASYKTPGVYIEESQPGPPAVVEVPTAIPAFVGYTEKAFFGMRKLIDRPTKIDSLARFEDRFGGDACKSCGRFITVVLDGKDEIESIGIEPRYYLYDSIRLFYANGGGPCYVVSVGTYRKDGSVDRDAIERGIAALAHEDEPTILVVPDSVLTGNDALTASIHTSALAQCGKLRDRVAILDVRDGFRALDDGMPVDRFRANCPDSDLEFGAAYYPWVKTTLPLDFNEGNLAFLKPDPAGKALLDTGLAEVAQPARLLAEARDRIRRQERPVPPGGAIAGVFARVDSTRGVWKAPANVRIDAVSGPAVRLNDTEQEGLNVDAVSGKSVNAIRELVGRGTVVWGARTLAGNDNEWRYISVRRFFSLVEESIQKSTEWAVFEPNDSGTWTKLRGVLENYLIRKWQAGALLGTKPEQAFYVKIGLGSTMTQLDILEGRLIVEIGMAVLRPAEFIILRFSHKVQPS